MTFLSLVILWSFSGPPHGGQPTVDGVRAKQRVVMALPASALGEDCVGRSAGAMFEEEEDSIDDVLDFCWSDILSEVTAPRRLTPGAGWRHLAGGETSLLIPLRC